MIQEIKFQPSTIEIPIQDNEIIDAYKNVMFENNDVFGNDVEDIETFQNRIRNDLFNPNITPSSTRVINVNRPKKQDKQEEPTQENITPEPQQKEQTQDTTPKKINTNPVKGKYRLGSESTEGRKAYIHYNNESPYGYDFMYGGKPLLEWDITDLLKSRGFNTINNKGIHYGKPGRRTSSVGSANSYHRSIDKVTKRAMARDISIYGGTHADYDAFRKKLMGDPIVLTWMNLKGWGIINEITPQIRAKTGGTGNHFHFGPDRWAQRTWHKWLLDPNIPVTMKLKIGGIIKNRFK